ncbi:hypothetical protein CALVIDRAFT_484785 [Calocera viscosa TUFC12733]|uniref:Tc1-like transposase DDE domain-containing protein n=1 Tax=Calocera viscosa (strain TUFC12733) TaxID=1330018 RepID=A0A167K2B0_CALVF|nr:hypothetical protein CALVIDRAFT_484785 [Calocera viscosa TUFC12733]
MRLVFLPTYSPDYNPIELLFSAVKSRIQRNDYLLQRRMQGDDDFGVYTILHEIVWSTTPEDTEGWYRKCGYF